MSYVTRVVYCEENMLESRGVNSGCKWGDCVEIVVGGRVRVRSGEFGIEKGVED